MQPSKVLEKIAEIKTSEDMSLSDIPPQLQTSEKMLEKFPEKGPLQDPPRKGKTARKNKETPVLSDIRDGLEGIRFTKGHRGTIKYYRASDNRLFVSNYPYEREDGEGRIVHDFVASEDGDRRSVYVYKYDDPEKPDEVLGLASKTLAISVSGHDFKKAIVGSVFDSLEKETYKVDFLRTDVVFDNVKGTLKYGTQLRAVFNAASNNFQLFRNNREVEKSKDIFHEVGDINDAFKKVFHEDKAEVYKLAYNRFGMIGQEMKPNIGRALQRLRYFKVIETLYSAGVPITFLDSIAQGLISDYSRARYNSSTGRETVTLEPTWLRIEDRIKRLADHEYLYSYGILTLNLLGTKPADILMLPKWVLKEESIKNALFERAAGYRSVFRRLQRATINQQNTDLIREVMRAVVEDGNEEPAYYRDRRADLIIEILDAMEAGTVRDYKRLIRYLTFDVKFSQGIEDTYDAWGLLKDYYGLCNQMGIDPIRFPSSLKLSHDVAAFNQRKMSQTENNEVFEKVMDEFDEASGLDFKKKVKTAGKNDLTWEIVLPKTPKALIQEGSNLNHCVGSYVDNVVKKQTTIIFLREFMNVEGEPEDGKSLLTIEVKPVQVDERLAYFIQEARGNSNRLPTPQEEEFFAEWSKKKPIFRSKGDALKALSTTKSKSGSIKVPV